VSCVYSCGPCAEDETPYACQNLEPYDKVPHASSCAAWDGTFPTPKKGACTATLPTGDAAKYAGADLDHPGTMIQPGGRRLAPAGADFVFPDPNDMTSAVIDVPGTRFVIAVDTGYGDHLVRSLDTASIGSADPNVAEVHFASPDALNNGVAFSAPDRVFVTTWNGRVQALTFDVATGSLARDDARSIALPMSGAKDFYASGLAVSRDQSRLFVSGAKDDRLFVYDVTSAGPTYGTLLGSVSLGKKESYGVYVDPNDPSTHFLYTTQWADHAVIEVDVSKPAAPKVARTFQVEKNPQGLVFVDARWMIVGNDLGDSLSVIDRTSGTVTRVVVDASTDKLGLEPSSLFYDAPRKRLYATLAGVNALAAWDVDAKSSPPKITPVGALPTQWWPSGVVAQADGSLVITSLMARGQGPRDPLLEYELLHGGVQRVTTPSVADFTKGDADYRAAVAVDARAGNPTIDCPPGVDDFPVPAKNDGKPSPSIEHVVIVVRENKTFDGLLGDLDNVRGDPKMTMVPAAQMDSIWTNFRKLAREFGTSDNYYTPAVISTQGHLLTTHGRSDDYNEREWPITGYGRNLRGDPDSGGVIDLGRPGEGSLFDWLGNNNVQYDILGEIVGTPKMTSPDHQPLDSRYPGGLIQSIGYPDIEKSCYVAGRARVTCDLGKVTYMTLPNDHTQGLSKTAPTPETMFASNDEATGMLIDGLSHSPDWAKTLVIITEDDPSQGGESVDYHRTPLVLVSPWVKRKYVSHTNVDIASLHKLVAHILALPYPNELVKHAALPLDMFTSTPDYTPYTYTPRSRPHTCASTVKHAEQRLHDAWDWDEIDEQPGLGAQLFRATHDQQLDELPPDLLIEVERRELERDLEAAREAREARDP
jgi:hypothetical protein